MWSLPRSEAILATDRLTVNRTRGSSELDPARDRPGKDGSYRWLLWNATPHSAHGVIYSAARDITDRKRVEAERERLVRDLEALLAEVRTLRDILPISTYCKKIRDDEDYWQTVESYVSRHTRTRFSHGICPDCMETEVEPDLKKSYGE